MYTIGVGRREGAFRQQLGPFGSGVTVRESPLDEETLQEIADITNARFYRATDEAGLRGIYAEIDALEKSEVEVQHFTRYRELMGWFLIPALALLLIEIVLSQTVFRKIP